MFKLTDNDGFTTQWAIVITVIQMTPINDKEALCSLNIRHFSQSQRSLQAREAKLVPSKKEFKGCKQIGNRSEARVPISVLCTDTTPEYNRGGSQLSGIERCALKPDWAQKTDSV